MCSNQLSAIPARRETNWKWPLNESSYPSQPIFFSTRVPEIIINLCSYCGCIVWSLMDWLVQLVQWKQNSEKAAIFSRNWQCYQQHYFSCHEIQYHYQWYSRKPSYFLPLKTCMTHACKPYKATDCMFLHVDCCQMLSWVQTKSIVITTLSTYHRAWPWPFLLTSILPAVLARVFAYIRISLAF